MFCMKCGTDLPDDSQFCRKCGQAQSVSSTSAGAAAAVAPAPIRPSAAPSVGAKKKGGSLLVRLIILLVIVGAGAWYYLRVNLGEKETREVIATVAHTPVTLKDEVENLPANSWKAVGLNLPYTGTLAVKVDVVRGNPLDVYLTTSDQLDAMKRADWQNVKVYTDFSATKTKRDSRLNQGAYYLVLRDTSLGILSASASDVSVKVQLNP